MCLQLGSAQHTIWLYICTCKTILRVGTHSPMEDSRKKNSLTHSTHIVSFLRCIFHNVLANNAMFQIQYTDHARQEHPQFWEDKLISKLRGLPLISIRRYDTMPLSDQSQLTGYGRYLTNNNSSLELPAARVPDALYRIK